MDNILIEESWVNKTEGYMCGESGAYETYFKQGETGKLFRHCQKEYGKCVSKIYVDPNAKQVGWVFEKQVKYEDTHEPYIQETWVTLHNSMPVKSIKHDYMYV